MGDRLHPGDTVVMSVEVSGYPDGTPATFKVFEVDVDSAADPVTTVKGQVKGGRAEAEWTYEGIVDEDEPGAPEFVFECIVGKSKVLSEVLEAEDVLDLEFKDEDGQPVADAELTVEFADGTRREAKTDAAGKLRLTDIPRRAYEVRFARFIPFVAGSTAPPPPPAAPAAADTPTA
ncbi:MAG: carboxypeptidase regulatory-like domain-containing protein [Planctomycetes bacterium]|nr:carboxypeptidase regulatory-like domain-containing protein [Planctomycetota bacterium]